MMIAPVSPFSAPPAAAAPHTAMQRESGDAQSPDNRGLSTPQDVVAIGAGATSGSSGPAILPGLPQPPSQQSQPSQQSGTASGSGQTGASSTTTDGAPSAPATNPPQPGDEAGPDGKPLTDEQKAEVQKLAQTDRHVRQHEAAHAGAGGALAGAPHFDYETGPDGRQYAIGGEVPIKIPSISGGNQQGTIAQLEQVVRAALAPSDPSSQDRAVAAQAQAEIAQAEAKSTQQSTSGSGGASSSADGSGGSGNGSTVGAGGPGGSSAAGGTTGQSSATDAPQTAAAPGDDKVRRGLVAAFSSASAGRVHASGQLVDIRA